MGIMLSCSLDGCLHQTGRTEVPLFKLFSPDQVTGSHKYIDMCIYREAVGLHFGDGYELRLHVARLLRVLHVHGLFSWKTKTRIEP